VQRAIQAGIGKNVENHGGKSAGWLTATRSEAIKLVTATRSGAIKMGVFRKKRGLVANTKLPNSGGDGIGETAPRGSASKPTIPSFSTKLEGETATTVSRWTRKNQPRELTLGGLRIIIRP
jgi:hypothetical protein